jgi:5-dehydro-4-deoxyglucarate dehydratase
MKAEELRTRLRGVIAFPVTPFHSDFSLGLDGLRKNLRALLKHPMAAIVAAGGTGEMYSLTAREHGEVVNTIVEEVDGKIPVISGTGFNRQIGRELAQQSAGAGADAILALPPYYPGADDQGLAEYYAAIGSATSLPPFVYSRDWVNPTPAWVEKLAKKIPTLMGWKDGQGDIRRYQQIMNRMGDRLHWIGGIGDDCVPGYYSIGIRTYTSSIATVAPKLSLELHEAASAPDAENLSQLMRDYVIPLCAFARPAEGVRSVGDEGDDEPGWNGRRSRATSASSVGDGGQGRSEEIAGEMETCVVLRFDLRAECVIQRTCKLPRDRKSTMVRGT